ncbi:hypothetical protein [Streptomyces sp. HPF1205]|uniref:hypothetical protein n=1 Tax=Streptomyces sp. HPF1205 TaxID=2873262 RepID=UPI001CECC403|nr:hypothetical protein [Streptomyces sp. HPF1205]
MADTTRTMATLPTERVAEPGEPDNFTSGHPAEARQRRHELIGADLLRYQEEHGAFSAEELAEARSRIFGPAEARGAVRPR